MGEGWADLPNIKYRLAAREPIEGPMNLPQILSQKEKENFVKIQRDIVKAHLVEDEDKGLILPAIRGLSNPDLVDVLEWYSDRVKLFYPEEPLFDDHTALDEHITAFYAQIDRNTGCAILTDAARKNAIVLQAELPQFEWFCIGIFKTDSLSDLLDAKFSGYEIFTRSWLEEPSEVSGDSELSDYWNLYDNDDQEEDEDEDSHAYGTMKLSDLPLGELDVKIHRQIHSLWILYDNCGLSFSAFVSDLSAALGVESLAKSCSDGPLHSYVQTSIPNFVSTLTQFGFSQDSVHKAIFHCLKTINSAELQLLLPSGSF